MEKQKDLMDQNPETSTKKPESADRLKIEKDGNELEDFQFAARALSKSKKEKRPHLLYLYIEEGTVFATNGKRLHLFKTDYNLEPGFYEVVKNTASCIYIIQADLVGEYPKFDTVLDVLSHKELDIDFPADINNFFATTAAIIRNLPETHIINIDFIRDILKTDDWQIQLPTNKERNWIIFNSGKRTAILMPMVS